MRGNSRTDGREDRERRRTILSAQTHVGREGTGDVRDVGDVLAEYAKHKELMAKEFEVVITEIALRNTRSMAAHKRVGFETIHTSNFENRHLLNDKKIREIAIAENRIIITKDSDFFDYLTARHSIKLPGNFISIS